MTEPPVQTLPDVTPQDGPALRQARLELRLDTYMKEMARLLQAEQDARTQAEALAARLAESEAARQRLGIDLAAMAAQRRDLQERLEQAAAAAVPAPPQGGEAAEIRRLTEILAENNEALAAAQARLKHAERMRAEAEAARDHAAREFARSEHLRAELVGSTCWRITAPLRWLADLFGRRK